MTYFEIWPLPLELKRFLKYLIWGVVGSEAASVRISGLLIKLARSSLCFCFKKEGEAPYCDL